MSLAAGAAIARPSSLLKEVGGGVELLCLLGGGVG